MSDLSPLKKRDYLCILQCGKLLRYHVVDVHERASPQASWSIGEFVIQVIVIHESLAPFPTDHAKMTVALIKFGIGHEFSANVLWSVDTEAIESVAKERGVLFGFSLVREALPGPSMIMILAPRVSRVVEGMTKAFVWREGGYRILVDA
jgi:hypothetical protein